jgi:hypothetical protein
MTSRAPCTAGYASAGALFTIPDGLATVQTSYGAPHAQEVALAVLGAVLTAIIRAVDRSLAWRAALLQAVLIAVTAVVLAAALPRSFFEDWGWLAGPGAWGACALIVAVLLRLPPIRVLAGAALSGLLMLPGVVVGVHWIGAPLALLAFGVWCARGSSRVVVA